MAITTTPDAEVILDILKDKFSVTDEVTPATLFEDLGLDSLVLVELAVILEQRFAVVVEESELADAGHAEGVADLVAGRLGG